jgi:hypothetical protein
VALWVVREAHRRPHLPERDGFSCQVELRQTARPPTIAPVSPRLPDQRPAAEQPPRPLVFVDGQHRIRAFVPPDQWADGAAGDQRRRLD